MEFHDIRYPDIEVAPPAVVALPPDPTGTTERSDSDDPERLPSLSTWGQCYKFVKCVSQKIGILSRNTAIHAQK
jgi:hypothetical protein